MSSVDDIINQAAEKAKEVEATQTAVATQPPSPANDVAAYAPGAGALLSMDDAVATAMINDEWLKVKDVGLLIGDSKEIITKSDLQVEIDLTQCAKTICIKYGNPTVYKKTYDGITCEDGTSWAEAVAFAKSIDPKAYSYDSADIVMTVLKDNGPAKAGKILGHSLATTNWKEWVKFYKSIGNSKARVKALVGHKVRSKAGNNDWGSVTFELQEVLESQSQAA